MTETQDQLVTMLLIKHGGFAKVVDMWLYESDVLSDEEHEAVSKFLEDDRKQKPFDAKLQNTDEYNYISLKLGIISLEKD